MAMPTPILINVNYAGPRSVARDRHNIATISREALIRFSRHAASRLNNRPNHRNYFLNTHAPESAIRHVLDWMQCQADDTHPIALTHPHDFDTILWVLQICRHIRVNRDVRGDNLEVAARLYMRTAPLMIDEFAMVFEVVPFAKDLQKYAVAETERRVGEEGERGVPDWDKIKGYCMENGIEIAEGEVRSRIASDAAGVR